MIFTPTRLAGAWIVAPEPQADQRGFFARTWCGREFEARGLETRVAQVSVSYTARRGTLRGMHYQAAPHEEVKLVRCIRGSIYDVIIDLRPASPTYCEHVAVILSDWNRLALYVPKGCAHGFQALADDSEVWYQISEFHSPDHARGVRWDDPAFSIDWPLVSPIIFKRDNEYAPVASAQVV